MGRVFGTIQVDGKRCRTLFDSGATNSYISAGAAKGLAKSQLHVSFPAGIGGRSRRVTEYCVLDGKLEGRPINVKVYILDEIGRDQRGRRIDVLLGALAMQEWSIILVPKEERLDLSHYPKEFIEFGEAPAAAP